MTVEPETSSLHGENRLGNGSNTPPEEANKEHQNHTDRYGDPGRKPWVSCVIREVVEL